MNPAGVAALTAIAAATFTFLAWAASCAWRVIRRTMHFLDDWLGEPAHDGLPVKPGVMARLRSVEEQVARIVAETTLNGGGSLRDVVARTAVDVADIKHEQAGVRTRLELRGSTTTEAKEDDT